MKINVTARDIKYGKRGMSNACPVARAIRRHPGFGDASVCSRAWSKNIQDEYHELHELPNNVIDWVYAFDIHGHVEPFSFELDV